MKAYAAKLEGELLLNTVYPSMRGAKVNFLGTKTNFMPRETWTDEVIDGLFGVMEQSMNVRVVEIEITEIEQVFS